MLRSFNAEPFAMSAEALEAFLAKLARIETGEAVKLSDEQLKRDGGYCVQDGTAVIPVVGALLKSDADAELYRWFGEDATSYGEILRAVDAAEGDPTVARIQLAVDSPGGQVSGIHAVADRIHGATKPVAAHIETLGASAAYWIASQADEVTASRGAMVGSIGAYVPVVDTSGLAQKMGIKVHVVSSGKYKGGGVPGAEVKAEHLAEIQARIDGIHAEFVSDVIRGRSSKNDTLIRESADGRVYANDESVTRGLIDRISSDPEKDRKMAEATDRKNYAALLKEFPGHAATIAEEMVAGAEIAGIRAKIEKAEADKVAAAREADLAKIKADLDAAVKADAEKAEALKALEAKLADVQKSHDALKALADGAKAGNAVKADAKADDEVKTADDLEALGAIDRAKFFARGGKLLVK